MEKPILFFDGVCHLCGASARFFRKRDRAERLRLIASQTEEGQEILAAYPQIGLEPTSLVLLDRGKLHLESEAVLRALRYLPSPWRWLAWFRVLPRPLRDFLYRWIARNRYRWFGKSEEVCDLNRK